MRIVACVVLVVGCGCATAQQCKSVPSLPQVKNESSAALEGSDPRALSEALTLVERRIEARPEDAESKSLAESESSLRQTLKAEIEERVDAAHQQALEKDTLPDAMREWQVASFYLGLLPEARSASEASHYQGLLTEHGLIRDRIKRANRVRYSLWAVRRMRKFAATVDWQRLRPGTNEDHLYDQAAESLGSIDTDRLRPEAMALYQSILQTAFQELNRKDRVELVERIEGAQAEELE